MRRYHTSLGTASWWRTSVRPSRLTRPQAFYVRCSGVLECNELNATSGSLLKLRVTHDQIQTAFSSHRSVVKVYLNSNNSGTTGSDTDGRTDQDHICCDRDSCTDIEFHYDHFQTSTIMNSATNGDYQLLRSSSTLSMGSDVSCGKPGENLFSIPKEEVTLDRVKTTGVVSQGHHQDMILAAGTGVGIDGGVAQAWIEHLDKSRELNFLQELNFSRNIDISRELDFSREVDFSRQVDFSRELYTLNNIDFSSTAVDLQESDDFIDYIFGEASHSSGMNSSIKNALDESKDVDVQMTSFFLENTATQVPDVAKRDVCDQIQVERSNNTPPCRWDTGLWSDQLRLAGHHSPPQYDPTWKQEDADQPGHNSASYLLQLDQSNAESWIDQTLSPDAENYLIRNLDVSPREVCDEKFDVDDYEFIQISIGKEETPIYAFSLATQSCSRDDAENVTEEYNREEGLHFKDLWLDISAAKTSANLSLPTTIPGTQDNAGSDPASVLPENLVHPGAFLDYSSCYNTATDASDLILVEQMRRSSCCFTSLAAELADTKADETLAGNWLNDTFQDLGTQTHGYYLSSLIDHAVLDEAPSSETYDPAFYQQGFLLGEDWSCVPPRSEGWVNQNTDMKFWPADPPQDSGAGKAIDLTLPHNSSVFADLLSLDLVSSNMTLSEVDAKDVENLIQDAQGFNGQAEIADSADQLLEASVARSAVGSGEHTDEKNSTSSYACFHRLLLNKTDSTYDPPTFKARINARRLFEKLERRVAVNDGIRKQGNKPKAGRVGRPKKTVESTVQSTETVNVKTGRVGRPKKTDESALQSKETVDMKTGRVGRPKKTDESSVQSTETVHVKTGRVGRPKKTDESALQSTETVHVKTGRVGRPKKTDESSVESTETVHVKTGRVGRPKKTVGSPVTTMETFDINGEILNEVTGRSKGGQTNDKSIQNKSEHTEFMKLPTSKTLTGEFLQTYDTQQTEYKRCCVVLNEAEPVQNSLGVQPYTIARCRTTTSEDLWYSPESSMGLPEVSAHTESGSQWSSITHCKRELTNPANPMPKRNKRSVRLKLEDTCGQDEMSTVTLDNICHIRPPEVLELTVKNTDDLVIKDNDNPLHNHSSNLTVSQSGRLILRPHSVLSPRPLPLDPDYDQLGAASKEEDGDACQDLFIRQVSLTSPNITGTVRNLDFWHQQRLHLRKVTTKVARHTTRVKVWQARSLRREQQIRLLEAVCDSQDQPCSTGAETDCCVDSDSPGMESRGPTPKTHSIKNDPRGSPKKAAENAGCERQADVGTLANGKTPSGHHDTGEDCAFVDKDEVGVVTIDGSEVSNFLQVPEDNNYNNNNINNNSCHTAEADKNPVSPSDDTNFQRQFFSVTRRQLVFNLASSRPRPQRCLKSDKDRETFSRDNQKLDQIPFTQEGKKTVVEYTRTQNRPADCKHPVLYGDRKTVAPGSSLFASILDQVRRGKTNVDSRDQRQTKVDRLEQGIQGQDMFLPQLTASRSFSADGNSGYLDYKKKTTTSQKIATSHLDSEHRIATSHSHTRNVNSNKRAGLCTVSQRHNKVTPPVIIQRISGKHRLAGGVSTNSDCGHAVCENPRQRVAEIKDGKLPDRSKAGVESTLHGSNNKSANTQVPPLYLSSHTLNGRIDSLEHAQTKRIHDSECGLKTRLPRVMETKTELPRVIETKARSQLRAKSLKPELAQMVERLSARPPSTGCKLLLMMEAWERQFRQPFNVMQQLDQLVIQPRCSTRKSPRLWRKRTLHKQSARENGNQRQTVQEHSNQRESVVEHINQKQYVEELNNHRQSVGDHGTQIQFDKGHISQRQPVVENNNQGSATSGRGRKGLNGKSVPNFNSKTLVLQRGPRFLSMENFEVNAEKEKRGDHTNTGEAQFCSLTLVSVSKTEATSNNLDNAVRTSCSKHPQEECSEQQEVLGKSQGPVTEEASEVSEDWDPAGHDRDRKICSKGGLELQPRVDGVRSTATDNPRGVIGRRTLLSVGGGTLHATALSTLLPDDLDLMDVFTPSSSNSGI